LVCVGLTRGRSLCTSKIVSRISPRGWNRGAPPPLVPCFSRSDAGDSVDNSATAPACVVPASLWHPTPTPTHEAGTLLRGCRLGPGGPPGWILPFMTAVTKIERSGPAISAALAELSADECTQFGAEFHQALGHAAQAFDLAAVDAVVDRWWGIAAIRVNPLSEHEQAQVDRAHTGDFTGLLARDEQGNWVWL